MSSCVRFFSPQTVPSVLYYSSRERLLNPSHYRSCFARSYTSQLNITKSYMPMSNRFSHVELILVCFMLNKRRRPALLFGKFVCWWFLSLSVGLSWLCALCILNRHLTVDPLIQSLFINLLSTLSRDNVAVFIMVMSYSFEACKFHSVQ